MRKHLRNTLLAGAALIALPLAAHATVINYSANGSGTDGALSADATFTTAAGKITIVLTNDLAANVIRSAGQGFSDISFALSNAPGTLGATTAVGQQGDVSGSGLVTYTTGSPGRFLGVGGGLFTIVGNTITLEAIGGGKPDQMIAPFIANGGTYANVNNGFQQHAPYTIGPATFVLNLSGVTANTTVTAATFSFGTGPDTYVPGTTCTYHCDPVHAPEPGSIALLGVGLIGLGTIAARRRNRSRV